jgi:D-psicose/D-tagatose/L-ribulose 3-epimerase
MRFGICCNAGSLAQEGDSLDEKVARLADFARRCDLDFVEFPVGEVRSEGDEAQCDELHRAVRQHALPLQSFNVFLPAHHRITGPDVQLHRVLDYCRVALGRCAALGGQIVVLGSSGARRVPEGWSHEEARSQFIAFARALEPIAAQNSITIAVEPLNRREDNFLNSVLDGIGLVDEIACSHIQLLADQYHMDEDGEDYEHVAQAGTLLCHAHTADSGRFPPDFAPEGEAQFKLFFAALRLSGYAQRPDARLAVECNWSNLNEQAAPAIALLRRRWDESAA